MPTENHPHLTNSRDRLILHMDELPRETENVPLLRVAQIALVRARVEFWVRKHGRQTDFSVFEGDEIST